MCDIFCANGHILDANGCPLCGCNPSPPPPPPADPCASVRCAAGTHCASITPDCPKEPMQACPAFIGFGCVPDVPPPPPPAPVRCGGFAGIQCAGTGKCVDDPSDSCDAAKGDADCSGICQCVQSVACVRGSAFDASPNVCACVAETVPPPSPPICGPVCQIFCQYGNVLDARGCKTCQCNPAPVAP